VGTPISIIAPDIPDPWSFLLCEKHSRAALWATRDGAGNVTLRMDERA